MRYEIKNTSSQPLLIVVGTGQTKLKPRETIVVDEKSMNDQIRNLKARGLVKVANK